MILAAKKTPARPAPPAPPKGAPATSAAGAPEDEAVRAARNIARWRKAPWLFVREVFKAEPDPWQDEVLHALVGQKLDGTPLEGPSDKIALKACKGPGKSCLLAWIIWWFMVCFTHPKILCTSITGENLRDGLWAELALWRSKSQFLIAYYEWQSERIFAKQHPETWFASARSWPKDADKTKQANTLAGQHAKHSMIVVDEAGDIPVGVLSAGLAHHSTQDPNDPEVHYSLLAGNPTCTDGALGWACVDDAKNWYVKEITGDPNDPMRAPRIDKKWAQDQIDNWGAENPWVLVNVFGKFPPVQSNKLIGPEQVRAAMRVVLPEALSQREPRIMALDVARSLTSDRSALCRRQGRVVYPFITYRLDDLMQLAGQVAFEYSRWPAQVIFIDMVGLGAGVFDRLRELGLPVVGIFSGNPARDARFADVRTEMWWNGAMAIKGMGGTPALSLPSDPELLTELCGPTISFNDKGKLKLESKDKMKKRGVGSPDVADSLMFTYAEPVVAEYEFSDSIVKSVRRGRVNCEYDPFAEIN